LIPSPTHAKSQQTPGCAPPHSVSCLSTRPTRAVFLPSCLFFSVRCDRLFDHSTPFRKMIALAAAEALFLWTPSKLLDIACFFGKPAALRSNVLDFLSLPFGLPMIILFLPPLVRSTLAGDLFTSVFEYFRLRPNLAVFRFRRLRLASAVADPPRTFL